MGCAMLTTLKAALLAGFLCLNYLEGTHGQVQNTVIALAGTDVELTIVIPNNTLVNSVAYITIRLDSGGGVNVTDVLYSINGQASVKTAYNNTLTASQTGKTLKVQARNVAPSLAGTFLCYASGSQSLVSDCGQLLIIIRKPSPPVIKVMQSSSALVGSRLALLCETHSTSLPPNHGLASKILWYNQDETLVSQGRNRIEVTAQGQLVIDPLERTDKGVQFYCISADSTGDVNKEIRSDRSAPFVVVPEYKPLHQDFLFTPAFEDKDVVVKELKQQISYRCDIDCSPQCHIIWLFKPSTGSADFGEVSGLADKKDLALTVDRTKDGSYKCRADNTHGVAEKGFELKSSYIETPAITINDEDKTSARLPEYSQVKLKCAFDSYPTPVVNWISPSQESLSTRTAEGPVVTVEGGVTKQLFTSTYASNNLRCEDAGVYTCAGRHVVGAADGRIELVITCPPSSANVPGLGLKEEYAWQIPQPLSFDFVIRAFPEPNVTQIISSLNGVVRNEEISKDVDIIKTPNHDGKAYLTKFVFTSKRTLGLNDANRDYTMTLVSSDFKSDFAFRILPRGRPHKPMNLTAVEVGYDYLVLVWQPGFSGGETQTFSVQYRVGAQPDLESGKNYSWTTSLENIADSSPGNWIRVQIPSLKSETDYVFRVSAINSFGGSAVEVKIRTAASSSSLGAGAICGIVFGVLILVAIIALVIFLVIYRKRFGSNSGHGETRKERLMEQLASLFRKDNRYKSRPATGARMNGSAARESPWQRVKKIFVRSSPRSSTDYLNVPPKDYNLDESNKSPMNNNAHSPGTPDSGRKMNSDGLVYVDVEFAGGKRKNTKPTDKKKKKKKEIVHKSNENVNYTDIDFSKTAAKKRELEQEEDNEREKEAGEDDYESVTSENKYADAGYGIGTTV